MFSTRLVSAIGLVLITLMGVSTASAADYVPPPPAYTPPPQPCCSNWYLRGNIGVGLAHADKMEYLRNPANNNNFAVEDSSISDSYFLGFGVGYEFNNWLRFDATAEYRGKTRVKAFGSYTYNGGTFGDAYDGYIKSWVLLANAYVDLGTWDCLTPFVGAGVGGAYNTLADFTDIGIFTSGRGVGRNSSNWSLAWALYAGVAYNLSQNLKLEMAYRYLNYGSVTDTVDCMGGCAPDSYKFSNLHSNDIMLSLRWTCCELTAAAPPPRYYAPPPRYYTPPPHQPPLHAKD